MPAWWYSSLTSLPQSALCTWVNGLLPTWTPWLGPPNNGPRASKIIIWCPVILAVVPLSSNLWTSGLQRIALASLLAATIRTTSPAMMGALIGAHRPPMYLPLGTIVANPVHLLTATTCGLSRIKSSECIECIVILQHHGVACCSQ